MKNSAFKYNIITTRRRKKMRILEVQYCCLSTQLFGTFHFQCVLFVKSESNIFGRLIKFYIFGQFLMSLTVQASLFPRIAMQGMWPIQKINSYIKALSTLSIHAKFELSMINQSEVMIFFKFQFFKFIK